MGTEAGKVYVVHNECIRNTKGGMPYKVGITQNTVSDRYYGLGLKMPGKFVCDFAYEFGNGYNDIETDLHNILDPLRENGEWFNITGTSLTGIRSICEKAGGVPVTDNVGEDLDDLQDEDGEGERLPAAVNPDLEKIVTRWDAVSDMKTVGEGLKRRSIRIPAVNGVYYRFIIKPPKAVHIDLHCNGSDFIDVLESFDKIDIKGHVFEYKTWLENKKHLKANVFTTVPLAKGVDGIVEVMRLLIEATKGKIIERYNAEVV
jgi:hypothetical protein